MQINDLIADMKNLSAFIQSDQKFEAKITNSITKIKTYISNKEQKRHADASAIQNSVERLMKLSFEAHQRKLLVQVGGLRVLVDLLRAECQLVGIITTNEHNLLIRRYCCMALTNLTYGDPAIKYWLCCDDLKHALTSLLDLLKSTNDDLRQAVSCVMRNLCWKVDGASKLALQESGCIKCLMLSAMSESNENTLKAMLAALWNVSAHSKQNKKDICELDGSLKFLVKTIAHTNKKIVENSGGILRNISSQIALNNTYRTTLRNSGALSALINNLHSSNDIIMSNACGTLWNLSARCPLDQRTLISLGAKPILEKLTASSHRMISRASTAVLKNLAKMEPKSKTSSYAPANLESFPEPQDSVVSFHLEGTPPLTRNHSLQNIIPNQHHIAESINEVPMKYEVEDTPIIISRVSSLSSLQAHTEDPSKKSSVKNVPFEQTPLMYSRTSSLQSLKDYEDISSVNSDVISIYSHSRESEMVSPADLPDSPSDVSATTTTNIISASTENREDEDKPKMWADEGDVETTSALSALTIDSNPISNCPLSLPAAIIKESLSNRIAASDPGVPNKEQEEDASDSSLSGEEEDAELLQQVIDSALPKTRPRSEPSSSKDRDGLFKKPIGMPPKSKARRPLNV
ncbi:DgyrCDS8175 [Dimorphilus gyrociliatus]|uniref:DgyrCDS8175 n=1 Tax=Dimorphilus gyrociliatus TaxID=2664684 RepID=A0A7I8VTD9_9ANNE|nr:DgyrCDS8175 [Dimorphilus gyrociliatus]